MTELKIKELLIEAEESHAEYEKTLGHPDPDWASYYAKAMFVRMKQVGENCAWVVPDISERKTELMRSHGIK